MSKNGDLKPQVFQYAYALILGVVTGLNKVFIRTSDYAAKYTDTVQSRFWSQMEDKTMFLIYTGTDTQGYVLCVGSKRNSSTGAYISMQANYDHKITYHYMDSGTWTERDL